MKVPLYEFQRSIVNFGVDHLRTTRGLEMRVPCGYGKPLMQLAIAKKLAPQPVTIVCSPCLAQQYKRLIKRYKIKNVTLSHTKTLC